MGSGRRKASGVTRGARVEHDVDAVVAKLRRLGERKTLAGLARFGLPADKAFGVPMAKLQKLAKELGRSHALAAALWRSGWTDARMLAAFVDEPELVTVAQMERWASDFDSWGICDTVCFALFGRTRQRFAKIKAWSTRRAEFEKRAAFALLASVALHDREVGDAQFLRCLPLCERAASDERNFVKKGVSWALRGVGQRNFALHAAAVELAERLAAAPDATRRWVGKDVLRDLARPLVRRRLEARARKASRA